MLKELIEYGNSIKKTQEEIKFTLSEIKIYREPTVGGDEAKIQINDLEHKEEKSIQSKQQEEKKNSKQQG